MLNCFKISYFSHEILIVKYFILFSFLGVFFLTSCNKGDDLSIDAPLRPYFDSFKEEATLRGYNVDYESEGITGFLGGISGSGIIGQCNSENKAITIDRVFWAGFDVWEREHLIYHELGHCFLGRGHCDKINNDGSCFSIMYSNAEDCDSNYNEETRQDYLDEIFDPNYADACP